MPDDRFPVTVSGVLPVYKPSGIGSFDVIRGLKKRFRFDKIGHAGTLDPLAEGVLPILVNEASKAFDYLLASDKIYRAVIRLGVTTDTDDADGAETSRTECRASLADIESALTAFEGEILQTPPRYSALNVDGKRAYDLARKDEDFDLAPRKVFVRSIDVENFDAAESLLTVRIVCGSGTYIRSIARDLGESLGCGGHVARLYRLKAAGVTDADCVPPEQITADNVESLIVPLSRALGFLPSLASPVPPASVLNGVTLTPAMFPDVPDGVYRLTGGEGAALSPSKDGAPLLALVERKDGRFRYLRVFRGL